MRPDQSGSRLDADDGQVVIHCIIANGNNIKATQTFAVLDANLFSSSC